ncbi:fungal hydrophobin [Coniophora puteana RWD-64-598 SS2]|uniref:Hydrophobin n=1 Tax=Coniophora puteana (strain RWD-64-598) TaxID=741705 RepID=A0A5M3MKN4_CONPW|nr:fungal hydrophobin [Coniophora puteana RWD-64-598 SS2]EIW79530.1 fungal hydrophobin [Coniophora puteana RWD-64-598 SS2]
MHASTFAALTFAAVVAAGGAGQCNTGSAYCCNQVKSVQDKSVTKQLTALGVVVEGLTGQAGLDCSPLNVLSTGAGTCNQHPVCCTNNKFTGLINLGCSPINVNL